VDDGVTGYLCRPRDVDDLVAALKKFIALPAAERRTMGQRGRAKMETGFDEALVIGRYLDLASRTAS
jgi:glycosyltransferase involved in cell wall biosynthesis